MEVAETELRARRFLNRDSASKSIHDACARRMEGNIRDFDKPCRQMATPELYGPARRSLETL